MVKKKKKLISICCPVFNEEENITKFYAEMKRSTDQLSEVYDFEFLFTDNRSTDGTFALLSELSSNDHRIRVLRFSLNFGYQKSILTNFINTRGDAAIMYDCDLQDPPELLPKFLEKWEEGYEVVFGIRQNRQENFLLQGLRKLHYRLLSKISPTNIPNDAGDFRLIDRRIIEELKNIIDYSPYLRGSIAKMGFRQIGIPYERLARTGGISKFPLEKMFGLSIDSIMSQSLLPLRISTFFSILVLLITVLGISGYFVGWSLFRNEWPPGFTTLALLMLSSIGLNALFIGIIGEYLGRVYEQQRNKPTAIIDVVIDHRTEESQNK